jgi:hypothetical protein
MVVFAIAIPNELDSLLLPQLFIAIPCDLGNQLSPEIINGLLVSRESYRVDRCRKSEIL